MFVFINLLSDETMPALLNKLKDSNYTHTTSSFVKHRKKSIFYLIIIVEVSS